MSLSFMDSPLVGGLVVALGGLAIARFDKGTMPLRFGELVSPTESSLSGGSRPWPRSSQSAFAHTGETNR
jgi:hypothetical protein